MWLQLIKSRCLLLHAWIHIKCFNNIASFIKYTSQFILLIKWTMNYIIMQLSTCVCVTIFLSRQIILQYSNTSTNLYIYFCICQIVTTISSIFLTSSSSHVVLGVVFPSLPITYQQMVQTWQTFMNKSSHPWQRRGGQDAIWWPPLQQAAIAYWELTRPESRLHDDQSDYSPTANCLVSFCAHHDALGVDDGLSRARAAERLNLNQQLTSKKPQSLDQ